MRSAAAIRRGHTMKMKKILSGIISVAMLTASMSLPAFADYDNVELYDYSAEEYDAVVTENTFDDGTVTNTIDNTNAKAVTTEEIVYTLTDTTVMTKEYFMSYDFCFDTDGGSISIKNNGKQGPLFSISDGQLRTQTGKSSFDNLGEAAVGTWYTAEFEGTMVVPGAVTKFRLYKYVDGVKTLVKETDSLNLRQFYAGASNGNPDRIILSNVSIDNLKIVQEYPNLIDVSSVADEVNAGSNVSLDYTMKRNDVTTTKYNVTWSVYNEDNTAEITDGSATITSDGVLVANKKSTSKIVTVRATATLGGKELVGTKKITINAVDTSNEKFDEISISGDDALKAGTSATYTVTASKDGQNVTSTLTDEDVVWSIYDYADIYPNGNTAITVSNGTLTVADGVIAQNITLRATSKSGKISGSKAVEIKFSDSQVEKVLISSACETTVTGMDKVESIDGSSAYQATTTTKLLTFGDTEGYVLTEMDIKFTAEGSGFTLNRADGTLNSCFRYHNGKIQMQTGTSNYSELMTADSNKWYHLEVLYSAGAADASCNIYEYNEDGTLGAARAFLDISRRNGKNYGTLQIETGAIVDNIKIATPQANSIDLSAVSTHIYSGGSDQISAVISRNGLPLKGDVTLEWDVLDSNNLPIIDGSVEIDGTGLMTTKQMTPSQTVKVQAKSGSFKNTIAIEIELIEPFTITNIGVNEAKDKIVKLYVDKKAGYNDDVLFIVAIYEQSGVLKGFKSVSGEGKSYSLGENEVGFDFDLTSINFNSESDIIKGFVWTRF